MHNRVQLLFEDTEANGSDVEVDLCAWMLNSNANKYDRTEEEATGIVLEASVIYKISVLYAMLWP